MSCQYCFELEMISDYLIHPCYCKAPIHVSCFLKWYQNHPSKCILCNSPYHRLNTTVQNMYESPYSDVFFPYDAVYPDLSGEKGLHRYRSMEDQIFMAISFLQVDPLESILKQCTYFDCFKRPLLKKITSVFITGRVPSKYPFIPNYESFLAILNILEKYVSHGYLGFQPITVRNHFERLKTHHNNPIRMLFCSLFN